MRTNHNALTRVIQFVCKHRRSYEIISFEKEQTIVQLKFTEKHLQCYNYLKSIA